MAAALSGAAAPAQAATPTLLERLLHDNNQTVLVASHRACWKKTSENSLDGIRRCIADGIDMVEIDVRTTRDDVLVLMHDETVDRTTDGRGAVAALTADQIGKLRLRERGGGSGTELTARHPPTFAQALAVVRGRVLMNIDVKAAALDRIIAEVQAAGATRDVVLNVPIDVDPGIVHRAQALGIAVQPVYLERESRISAAQALKAAVDLRPTAIQLIFDDPDILDTARTETAARRPRLFVNTMARDIATGHPMNLSGPFLDTRAEKDPEAVWGVLVAKGVTIIQTDDPWHLRRWLKSKGLR